jgi:hypothetical protein
MALDFECDFITAIESSWRTFAACGSFPLHNSIFGRPTATERRSAVRAPEYRGACPVRLRKKVMDTSALITAHLERLGGPVC